VQFEHALSMCCAGPTASATGRGHRGACGFHAGLFKVEVSLLEGPQPPPPGLRRLAQPAGRMGSRPLTRSSSGLPPRRARAGPSCWVRQLASSLTSGATIRTAHGSRFSCGCVANSPRQQGGWWRRELESVSRRTCLRVIWRPPVGRLAGSSAAPRRLPAAVSRKRARSRGSC